MISEKDIKEILDDYLYIGIRLGLIIGKDTAAKAIIDKIKEEKEDEEDPLDEEEMFKLKEFIKGDNQ